MLPSGSACRRDPSARPVMHGSASSLWPCFDMLRSVASMATGHPFVGAGRSLSLAVPVVSAHPVLGDVRQLPGTYARLGRLHGMLCCFAPHSHGELVLMAGEKPLMPAAVRLPSTLAVRSLAGAICDVPQRVGLWQALAMFARHSRALGV